MIVALLLLVDLRLGLFHQTAADPHNRAYAALEHCSPGRLLELPVFEAGSQSASVYLYYLMQAPHQHPSGYSTTAPLAADRRLRELQKTPCRYLDRLGVREVVTHYGCKEPSAADDSSPAPAGSPRLQGALESPSGARAGRARTSVELGVVGSPSSS